MKWILLTNCKPDGIELEADKRAGMYNWKAVFNGKVCSEFELEEDLEITGHPIITLYVTSTSPESAFFVYLEDVDETGRVTYVTEGQLRAIHRKISNEPPPYKMMVPYHTFKRNDVMQLVPGEIVELTFGLLPTSVLIRENHRIRIAIAGHDKDTFDRIPVKETPVITVLRNVHNASFIDIPIIART